MEPTTNQRKYQKLWVLFVFLLALLTYPLLSLFNKPLLISGIPLLFLYVFGSWVVGIVLIALLVSRSDKNEVDL